MRRSQNGAWWPRRGGLVQFTGSLSGSMQRSYMQACPPSPECALGDWLRQDGCLKSSRRIIPRKRRCFNRHLTIWHSLTSTSFIPETSALWYITADSWRRALFNLSRLTVNIFGCLVILSEIVLLKCCTFHFVVLWLSAVPTCRLSPRTQPLTHRKLHNQFCNKKI